MRSERSCYICCQTLDYMKQLLISALAVALSLTASSQIDLENRLKNKVNQRVEQKVDEAIDKSLDKTEEEAKEAAKGNKKEKKKKGEADTETTSGEEANGTAADGTKSAAKPTLKTYGKFDFVPGEKILIADQFENVAVGDYPVDWNTNSSAEIVTVEGVEGKWLQIAKTGVFMPDYITDLPENFTMQFDVMVNEDFNFYSDWFHVTFLSTTKREKLNDFNNYSQPAFGTRFGMHPMSAGSGSGTIKFNNFDKEGASIVSNESATMQFFAKSKNLVHVSVWRQKQRLRVYFNEEKVLDIPRAFDATAKYNAVSFVYGGGHQDQDRYLLGNIRLAVGAPDTRSKLITEGKLVTRGILFDSGSDKIKPESYGTLKDIAAVLTENPTVKVQIIGHTDSDGDDAKNLELSKKRAAAVKEALINEFKIDASRLETDGKGESQPSDKNDTAAGKANNRRVEFIKL